MTSSITNFARRVFPASTIPNTPNGNTEAKIARGPCLSSPVMLTPPPLLPDPAIVTVTVDDGLEVPSIGKEAGDAEQLTPEGAAHVIAKV